MRFKREYRLKRWLALIAAMLALFSCGAASGQCDNPDAGDCCMAHLGAGCSDQACCELIVALHPPCAEFWNVACRNLAIFYCEICGGSFGCGSSGPSLNPCCTANATPFCYDETCCESVCAVDPSCCDAAGGGVWYQGCADLAWKLCPDLPGCSPPPPPACGDAGTGACCSADGSPLCNHGECCQLVCDADPSCCDVAGGGEWDECCADLARELCVDPEPRPCEPCGTCCEVGPPGCSKPECEAAICQNDPWCCAISWDSNCVIAAQANPLCVCPQATLPCTPNTDCDNKCGQMFEVGCQCDDGCCSRGDCCPEFSTIGACGTNCDPAFDSCAGKYCELIPFWGCFCHSNCTLGVDCCADICQHCGHPDCNPADLTGNNIVGVADLLILLESWGECPGFGERCPDPELCPADFAPPGGDHTVGVADLLFLLQNWG